MSSILLIISSKIGDVDSGMLLEEFDGGNAPIRPPPIALKAEDQGICKGGRDTLVVFVVIVFVAAGG